MEKLIITVAPTGSIPRKKDTPHVPTTPEEIVEDCVACVAAGASILHLHARDEEENPSTRYDLFERMVTGLKPRTNAILQVSTGGRAGSGFAERAERLNLATEMASLTTGSVNFPESVYINGRELVEGLAARMRELKIKPEMEVFDASMVQGAIDLEKKGLVAAPLHFNFVLGLKGALPATLKNLLFLTELIPTGSTWSVTGVGKAQLTMGVHAMLMGGHVRVGLEDNIYYSRGRLAANAELVARIARLAAEFGREVASPDEARKILGLSSH